MASLMRDSLCRLRPYGFPMCLALYVPAALFVDARVNSLAEQYALGVVTAVFLGIAMSASPGVERRQVLYMVSAATAVELFSSLILGVYRYRLHNVPLYVPPGHGLIYLFALRWARTPFMERYGDLVCRVCLVLAACWALYGITVSPHLGGRADLLGFLLLPIFVGFMRRPNATVYAGAFLATSCLELFGTGFGDWTWRASMPVAHFSVGNPPSVIAGAYCVLDFIATSAGSWPARQHALGAVSFVRRTWPARAATDS